ncbi:unnamed protein product [Linum tenue]|uniref:Uncharacterized protein n=1 Tax=Linum tenue TaxID=586396 RepID=A0AAV0H0H0_9ROSI|nr:unnamed protein product [Linum tenue]
MLMILLQPRDLS